MNALDELARLFGLIAICAGDAVMQMRDAAAYYKVDGSPVTAADIRADEIIRDRLRQSVPELHIVTEEITSSCIVVEAERFVLVDPLDGTREFIRGSSEFTVNIALIERRRPTVGVVYAPALRRLYIGCSAAYRLDVEDDASLNPHFGSMQKIGVKSFPATGWRVMVSRSHLDSETQQWIDCRPVSELMPAGSSLKFCAIAEGEADVYPRLGPTMEWDTAAGHAVLLAAGGCVTSLNGKPLLYGKPGFRNDSFIAWGSDAEARSSVI